jgi:hypothetical protein
MNTKVKKLLSNAEAWLKSAEIEKDIVKAGMKAKFINEDGSIEDWDGLSEEEIVSKIDDGFKEFKTNFINKLKGEEHEINTVGSGIT